MYWVDGNSGVDGNAKAVGFATVVAIGVFKPIVFGRVGANLEGLQMVQNKNEPCLLLLLDRLRSVC